MPPIPLEYQGREAVARFFVDIGRQGRHYDVVPTRANGQLALGVHLRSPTDGRRRATSIDVLTLTGDQVAAMTHFDTRVLPSLGLPRSLPDR
jgi:RNA polymerase sigma-70 factor (ECF subfamily)